MIDLESLRMHMMFKSVLYSLEHRITVFSETSLFYIEGTIKYLDDVIKSLDTISYKANMENHGSYSFVPNLLEIVNISEEEEFKPNEESIKKLRTYIAWMKDRIQQYQVSPITFVNSADEKKIEKSIQQLVSIFTRDPVNIESDIKFNSRLVYA